MKKRKQRKPFTDMLGKPLQQEKVALAVRVVTATGIATTMQLNRQAGIGPGMGGKILALLEQAGVITAPNENGNRTVILRSEPTALNAALRKLREGNR